MPLPQDARRELCPASDAPGPPSVIESTLDDGVATVRLASPATANALTPAAFADLAAAVARWQHPDSGARALVLTGSGGVFSAGANLDVLGDADAAQLARQIGEALHPLLPLLRGGRLPTLAAVNGVAVGGAVGLALWCDVVVAASSARFSQPSRAWASCPTPACRGCCRGWSARRAGSSPRPPFARCRPTPPRPRA